MATARHSRGERNQRTGEPWRVSQWSLHSPLPYERPLDEHLGWLLDRVADSGAALAALVADGCACDWFCYVRLGSANAGVVLPPPLLARLLVALGLDVYS